MANNLFISYDLMQPGQGYEAVTEEIKKLGNWAKVNYSLWYVNSNLSASDAATKISTVMDNNDKLIVVDTTNNTAAWNNLSDEVANYIKDQWYK